MFRITDDWREIDARRRQFDGACTTEVDAASGGCRSCGCRGYRPNSPPNNYCATPGCNHHWDNHA